VERIFIAPIAPATAFPLRASKRDGALLEAQAMSFYLFVKYQQAAEPLTKPISPKLCPSVGEASELLKHLANPNRLAILCFLMEQESSVGTLEDELGIRQPTLSQQLGELREAGLIEGRREGKSILYQVTDIRVARLIGMLREQFAGLDDVTSRRAMNSGLSVDEMMFD
jgi:DNA-binding transcriptional ArsR family regulator